MALLTDIVVALPAEAEAVATALRPATRWPCLEFKGVDNAVMADLLSALGAEAEARSLVGTQRLLSMKGDQGPWVFHLPDVLMTLLNDLDDRAIPELARRWAQGELAHAGVEASDVEPGIHMLHDFARQAMAANKSLLLRMST
jgi:hypothetical protein